MVLKVEYLLIFLTIIFINAIGPIFEITQIGTYIIVPGTLLYFYATNETAYINQPLKLIFLLLVWGLIPVFFANVDMMHAFTIHRRLLVVFMYSMILFWYGRKSLGHSLDIFNFQIVTLFILVIAIISNLTGFELETTARLTNEVSGATVLNANAIGYFIFTAIISSFAKYISKPSTQNLLLIYVIQLVGLYFILVSASRSAMLVMLILFILIFYEHAKHYTFKNIFSFLLIPSIAISIFIAAIMYFINITKNSFLLSRFFESNSQDDRILHIFYALKVGLSNFILGVGPGTYELTYNTFNFGTFSHNTFTEIFVSYGIFGLIIYLMFIYSFISIKQNKANIKSFKNVFLVSFILYHFFYVTYLTPIFMGLAINSYIFLKHLQNKNNEENFIHSR